MLSVSRPVAVAMLAQILATGVAEAQQAVTQQTVTQQDIDALDVYRRNDAHLASLFKAIDQLEGVIRGECAKINIEGPTGKPEILVKPAFSGGDRPPTAGAWRERWQLDRCGKKVVYNVIVAARPGGAKPVFQVLVPGVTKTVMDPTLQGQVVNRILARTVERIPDCRLPLVADTFVSQDTLGIKYDAENRPIDGNWRETWVIFACGRIVQHNIKFDITENHSITMELEGQSP